MGRHKKKKKYTPLCTEKMATTDQKKVPTRKGPLLETPPPPSSSLTSPGRCARRQQRQVATTAEDWRPDRKMGWRHTAVERKRVPTHPQKIVDRLDHARDDGADLSSSTKKIKKSSHPTLAQRSIHPGTFRSSKSLPDGICSYHTARWSIAAHSTQTQKKRGTEERKQRSQG